MAHCQRAVEAWKEEQRPPNKELAYMQFLQGNGLEIDGSTGEAVVGFDRIYIGAAVDRRDLVQLANLLRPSGVLVGPGECDIVAVRVQRHLIPTHKYLLS